MSRRERYLTVGDIPRHYAGLPRTRDAEVLVADDRVFTWADIDEASNRVANGLARAELACGAKVALLLSNRAEFVELMYGIAKAGCVIVPLNPRYVAREVTYGINFADAEALITTDDCCELVEDILPDLERIDRDRVFVIGEATAGRSYEELKVAASPAPPAVEVKDDWLYWMPFTSGTTGNPKAAMVTHRALVEHWRLVVQTFEITSRDTTLIAGPFYHSLGFLFGLTGLFAGGRVVIHSAFEPARVLSTIGERGVTMTPMVPTMYTMILAVDGKDSYDMSSMRAVISAGSPLLTGTKNALLELFPNAGLYEFYGSTEIGLVSVLPPEDQKRKIRSVGLPLLGCQVRLVDPDGHDLAAGEAGEVCKRGLLLGAEYYKSPEATERMYLDGGWARSGDLGRLDEEGYLYIVDRTKDMIISGGANVFPSEIEEVISKHPSVLEVAVIGVPDETWGEAIKALVVLQPGFRVAAEDLIALCEENLASYKKPRSVDFVDELPKTGTGKILKRELRERYWSREDAPVR